MDYLLCYIITEYDVQTRERERERGRERESLSFNHQHLISDKTRASLKTAFLHVGHFCKKKSHARDNVDGRAQITISRTPDFERCNIQIDTFGSLSDMLQLRK